MKKSILIILIGFLFFAVAAHAGLFGKKIEPIPMTVEELAQYDGKDGNPAYVAVDGLIYDLSKCRYWKQGIHTESPEEGIAGRDMTELLKKSSHGIKRVRRYPHVGFLVEDIKKETAQ